MRAAGGSSGAWVYDGGAGRTVFKWSAAQPRVPASVQKLVTTSTALDRLGPEARFETTVLADGEVADGALDGSLYLRGSGDPTFGTSALTRLAGLVADTGLERITGRVYGDESFFDSRRGGPPAASGSRPMSARCRRSRSTTARCCRSRADGSATPPHSRRERLRVSLRREDVAVDAAGAHGRRPAGRAPPSRPWQSPPLESIVRHTNQVSDNYYAEMLLKGIGARSGGPGRRRRAPRVARAYAREAGFHARVVDGSGLSRGNKVAPRDVGQLLLAARKQSWFDSFYRSLPLAGRQRHAARPDARHARCGPLPREDRHARRESPRWPATVARPTETRSASRC